MLAISSLAPNPADAQEWLNGSWVIVESWGENDQSGEWQYENPQPSLFIFLDGYYSIALVRGNEPRPLMPEGATWDNMTEEQLRSVCSGAVFSANAGTYEVDGSSLTTKPMVAKWPNLMEGGSNTYVFEMEGDLLRLTSSGDGSIWNARLRRAR
jgi:hypothetical protein